jgi:hypothetical protein
MLVLKTKIDIWLWPRTWLSKRYHSHMFHDHALLILFQYQIVHDIIFIYFRHVFLFQAFSATEHPSKPPNWRKSIPISMWYMRKQVESTYNINILQKEPLSNYTNEHGPMYYCLYNCDRGITRNADWLYYSLHRLYFISLTQIWTWLHCLNYSVLVVWKPVDIFWNN